ncbi:glycosyl-4,4'-diaponeurosporenoate acyltransferase CrtO family protein [Telluribacter humicola]|uniref:glycosyl-4,4'-diaponeurosporenoate acyltransferase CrtO family protein n=1 Tax=Telluribacter humicola TaxID=1720261 RepID=UPI0035B603A3
MSKLIYSVSWYFREHSFENGGLVYKKVGIHHFKKIVPFGDYFFVLVRLFKPGISMAQNRSLLKNEAANLIMMTALIESIHILGFFFMSYLFLRKYVLTGELRWKIILLNIIVNLMPVLVQRYNRIRIVRTFDICQSLRMRGGDSSRPI